MYVQVAVGRQIWRGQDLEGKYCPPPLLSLAVGCESLGGDLQGLAIGRAALQWRWHLASL